MEGDRAGHSIKKLSMNNKGISLVSAILIALFALLALAGLYFALTKLLGSSQTIKTYASIRDAAAGGANYAVLLIHGKIITGDEYCHYPLILKFRLSETSGVFDNQIYVCFVGYQTPPGFPVPGVVYSKEIPGGKGNIYTIISEAEGPQGTRSRIEAVYTP